MHNRENNPLALGFLDTSKWMQIDGTDIDAVHAAAEFSIADIRNGRGPRFVWATVPRMCSHSCADDHRQYLPKEELTALQENDPLRLYRQRLTGDGIVAEAELESMETSLKEEIRETYAQAAKATDPNPAEAEFLLGHPIEPEILSAPLQNKPKKMVETVNRLFHAAVETNPDFIFFGEDVEDPKGGVFKLTEMLSTKYPSNAFNSPVAESTILGVSCGLASYGKRPIAEIQFIDFIAPGWNQLVSNIATLRWRTLGDWSCPMVIYAPSGAYLQCGGPWHSQSNEGDFARQYGLQVVVPSTPEDAAGLTWSAIHGADPVIVLLPKRCLHRLAYEPISSAEQFQLVRLVRPRGKNLTILAWGNCLDSGRGSTSFATCRPDAES